MVRLATGGPVRKYCRFLAAAKLRLAASSVGAMALPLHPPCVLASLAFRAPEFRQNLRPEPLPGLEEDPQPVAQEAGHEEVRAHVLLAVAAERLAQRRVPEDLQRPLRRLLDGGDEVAGLAVGDLQRDAADVAGDHRPGLPDGLGDCEPEALAGSMLHLHGGVLLYGACLERVLARVVAEEV